MAAAVPAAFGWKVPANAFSVAFALSREIPVSLAGKCC